ncbi:MAG: peptidase M3, partial [Prevotella sp.]|nr:peptidase M3 [Prevotella sp.]
MTSTGSNPFFYKYDTPHGTVPFGSFTLRHIEEAMMEGMQREKEQMERICNNTAEPTFDNTIIYDDEKEDGYYDLLDRASTVFFNILSADTDDEWDALANKMSPLLTQHSNDLRLNPVFFKRVKAVYDAYNGTGETTQRELSPEEKKLLEDTYMGLVRSGALLDEKGQETLRKLTEEAGL